MAPDTRDGTSYARRRKGLQRSQSAEKELNHGKISVFKGE